MTLLLTFILQNPNTTEFGTFSLPEFRSVIISLAMVVANIGAFYLIEGQMQGVTTDLRWEKAKKRN